MQEKNTNGPQTPEEFQKQLQEFMKQHFSGSPIFVNKPEMTGAPEEPKDETAEQEFIFDRKPRDVKAYLDRFVIKQEEAKKVLSVALCDHYHHVRLAMNGKGQSNYAKQNVILV